jgi:hypothetical protein
MEIVGDRKSLLRSIRENFSHFFCCSNRKKIKFKLPIKHQCGDNNSKCQGEQIFFKGKLKMVTTISLLNNNNNSNGAAEKISFRLNENV